MSFNVSAFLSKIAPAVRTGARYGLGFGGGAVLSETANAGHRMGTGEDLSPAARATLGMVGGGALMGKLSAPIASVARNALPAAALSRVVDGLHKNRYGYAISDPEAARKRLKQEGLDYAKELAGPILETPPFRDLLSNDNFQFSSLHSAPSGQLSAVDRVRAYVAKRSPGHVGQGRVGPG